MRNKISVDFWSSTEYSGFLEGLMRELNAHGFAARQRFQISEASYRSAKSPLARLWLRFQQYIGYPLRLLFVLGAERLVRRQATICVVSTNTFYAPFFAAFIHPNVVHLVYDLYPEALIHSGKWKEGTLKAKCIHWITGQTLKRSKQNVFLGQRLKEYVESLHGPMLNAAIIEVGADQSLFDRSPEERSNNSDGSSEAKQANETPPEILYCGNFGNLHDSATLFQYWNTIVEGLKHPDKIVEGSSDCELPVNDLNRKLSWSFFCSGPKRAELLKVRESLPEALKNQIRISGGLGQAEWVAVMETADIALVTMTFGSETVVMPSKTYSAMMAGQAILAIAPENSDLVDTIKAANCGWWVEPGDITGLKQVLETICSNPDELLEKRERAYHYAHSRFGQDALAEKWQDVFKQLM